MAKLPHYYITGSMPAVGGRTKVIYGPFTDKQQATDEAGKYRERGGRVRVVRLRSRVRPVGQK